MNHAYFRLVNYYNLFRCIYELVRICEINWCSNIARTCDSWFCVRLGSFFFQVFFQPPAQKQAVAWQEKKSKPGFLCCTTAQEDWMHPGVCTWGMSFQMFSDLPGILKHLDDVYDSKNLKKSGCHVPKFLKSNLAPPRERIQQQHLLCQPCNTRLWYTTIGWTCHRRLQSRLKAHDMVMVFVVYEKLGFIVSKIPETSTIQQSLHHW